MLLQLPTGDIEALGKLAVLFFVGAIVFAILIMVGLLWLGWWVTLQKGSVSPYSRQPMGLGEDVAAAAARQVKLFLQRHDPVDNPVFDMRYAAVCRETGRVFPDCVNRLGLVRLDWSFLKDRYKGNWISWGSLTPVQQGDVSSCHDSIEGFQMEVSSPRPFPKDIDMFHATAKPGPLYVDLSTKILMGWKCVPETSLEVLIVQRPYYTREQQDHSNIDV